MLCNQKIPVTTQRHQIFSSRYSIKDKACNLIIDNGSCENIVSRALVDHLKLETKSHHHPNDIGWIKQGFLYPLVDTIKILLLVMSLTWTCAIFFWEDRSNMMLMLPIEEGRTYMCLLERIRELPLDQFHRLQDLQRKWCLHLLPAIKVIRAEGRVFLKREELM